MAGITRRPLPGVPVPPQGIPGQTQSTLPGRQVGTFLPPRYPPDITTGTWTAAGRQAEQTVYDRAQRDAELARQQEQQTYGRSQAAGEQSYSRNRTASQDAQIQALMAQMGLNGGSNGGGGGADVAPPDFSGMQGEQQSLVALLSKLQSGGGFDVGDVSTNPEAVANRVAVERAGTQQAGAEAERLAASGMTSSGESDARNAQIREQTGTQVAGFNAGLAGRLRGEAQQGAIAGAGLSLSNLSREMAQQQALYGARVDSANTTRQDAASKRQQQMDLLKSLLAQQGMN